MIDFPGFGRFAEPARFVLAALRNGPRNTVLLFDDVRALDGPIGPGTLYAAIARLEHRGMIEARTGPDGRASYCLSDSAAWTGAVPGGAG